MDLLFAVMTRKTKKLTTEGIRRQGKKKR